MANAATDHTGDSIGPGQSLAPVADAITRLVDDVFDSLQTVADSTRALWHALESSSGTISSADLMPLQGSVLAVLERQRSLFNGAGFIAADRVLADAPRYLEWWRSDLAKGGAPRKLRLDLDPDSEYFYDYVTMEWFTAPRDSGTRCVAGPYLDYTGVNLYVCTFAVPVITERGQFIGVAGADLPVARLDEVLWPTIGAHGKPLALANAEGRVIVANDAEHVAGSRLAHIESVAAVQVPSTPWSLVSLGGR